MKNNTFHNIGCIVIIVVLFGSFATYTGVAYSHYGTTTIEHKLNLPTSSPVSQWVLDDVTEGDKYCLALNIYFEARGEPDDGKYAVGEVVLFRTMHSKYPDDICGVIQDAQYHKWNKEVLIRNKCQFSWFCDGKSDNPVDGKAFEHAYNIANDLLTNTSYQSKLGYALFYHSTAVKPRWAKRLTFVDQIGDHKFYTN
jgi:spore germination cell wall hydrolase CwlJ-like protein